MITRTMAVLALAAALGGFPHTSGADPSDPCYVPTRVSSPDLNLPAVTERARHKLPLSIVILGTASSAGTEIGGTSKAYPGRLKEELTQRFPSMPVTVEVYAKRGQTAAEMVRIISQQVIPARPALVIWQTGTVEAVRGVDTTELGASLLSGIEALRKIPTDVILMTPQYSPRTAAMIDLARYADYMERLAEITASGFVDRYEIMRYWVEEGLITFDAPTPLEQARLVDRIHGCLARMLADRIKAAVTAPAGHAPAPER